MLIVSSRLKWLYGEMPGFVVLSNCSETVTERFVQRIGKRGTELAGLVPDEFLFHTSEPTLLILMPSARGKRMVAEMSKVMNTVAAATSAAPHLRLTEVDSTAMYFLLDDDPLWWSQAAQRWQPQHPDRRRPG